MNKENILNFYGLRKLIRTYKLNKAEVLKLRHILNSYLVSTAYTASGGFDPENGDFYAEDRIINYQLRIKYRLPKMDTEKFILLKKVKLKESFSEE